MAIKRSPADDAFSKCIRAQSNYTCVKCGAVHDKSSSGLHCSHNFGRRHRTIRWCKENALSLCFSCHKWFGESPADSGRWLEGFIGAEMVDILREKRDSGAKVSKHEEKDIAKHYRDELKKIEADPDYEFVSWQ